MGFNVKLGKWCRYYLGGETRYPQAGHFEICYIAFKILLSLDVDHETEDPDLLNNYRIQLVLIISQD